MFHQTDRFIRVQQNYSASASGVKAKKHFASGVLACGLAFFSVALAFAWLSGAPSTAQARAIIQPLEKLRDIPASPLAATLIVTNTDDSGAGSLRQALIDAQASDTIVFSLTADSIITVASELTMTQFITIDGTTATNLSVSGGGTTRVFNVSAPATFMDFTVMNGNVTGYGGGLYSTSAITLTAMRFLNNTADSGGGAYAVGAVTLNGGLFQYNTSTYSNGGGGGLWAASTLALTGTQFLSNTASSSGHGGGASVSGAATLNGGLFQHNAAGVGAGLYTGSTLALTGTQFLSNTALSAGGGASVSGAATLYGGLFQNNTSTYSAGGGGGLSAASTLALTGTQFISNTANGFDGGGGAYVYGAATLNGGLFLNNRSTGGAGGGLHAGSLILMGTQFISNTGGGASVSGAATLNGGLFQNNSGGGGLTAYELVLTGTQFISNTAVDSSGGGAYVSGAATLNGGLFRRNHCTSNLYFYCQGGGLYVDSTLVLSGTQFIGNTSGGNGGGTYVGDTAILNGGLFQNNDSTNWNGGGLYANSTLALTGTQFIANTASSNANSTGAGGGVYHYSGNGRIVNALFARNFARGAYGQVGAALYLNSTGSVKIMHTTIASPTLGSGSAIGINCGNVGITNTIISGYTIGIRNGICSGVYENYNLFFGNGTNKSGTFSAGSGTHDVSGDPKFLNQASDNYHLNSNSAAINAGIDVGVTTDLDGSPRPRNGGFDIGAYEFSFYTLMVATAGNGHGSMVPTPGVYAYAAGSLVNPTATPNTGSRFNGWSGACSGTGPCSITLTSNQNVTATFTLITYTLTISTTGAGNGSVTPTSGIYVYNYGTVVGVTSSVDGSSFFGGWSGACSGFNSCNVTMTANRSVIATFHHLVQHVYLPLVLKNF